MLNINFKSAVLGKACTVNVVVPREILRDYGKNGGNDKKFPVLYLFHGLSDDQDSWGANTNLEYLSNSHDIIIVMPNVDRSFYANTAAGDNYWTFVSEELPNLIAGLLPISLERKHSFVAGLSMGGYGALKLGLNFPERFCAIAAYSAVTNNERIFSLFSEPKKSAIFGPELIVPDDCDLRKLIDKCAALPEEMRPVIYHFCGTEDFMYEDNCQFRDYVQATKAFDYSYSESKGGHEWRFWNDKLKISLDKFDALTKN